jgi:type I restriction enzyme S subunit
LENGKIARFKASGYISVAHGSTELIVIRGRAGVTDTGFAYYLTQSPLVRGYAISQMTGTSGRQRVPIEAFEHLLVPIPPLPEQRAIAHILGTLDDKIELNRRMNETLEAMAQAMFKSWFIDFDPVRAKAEGRDTGLPPDVAALFPDSFQDSELGPIPEGWRISTIGAMADVIDCLHTKKPGRCSAGLPLLQLANIREDGLIDMQDEYLISESDYRHWVSRIEALPGDCVITNVGRVGAVAQMPPGRKAAPRGNMTAVRCKPSFPFPTALVECLLSEAMSGEISRRTDVGTILDALNVRNIPDLRFVAGSYAAFERFESAARPLRAQMERHLSESRVLAALRDVLLPKLLSGELRADDVGDVTAASG